MDIRKFFGTSSARSSIENKNKRSETIVASRSAADIADSPVLCEDNSSSDSEALIMSSEHTSPSCEAQKLLVQEDSSSSGPEMSDITKGDYAQSCEVQEEEQGECSYSVSGSTREARITYMPDLGTTITGPSQPYLTVYPKTVFGKQNRSFTSEYFKNFSFLEYSKQLDAMFCFTCRHFASSIKDSAFTEKGIKDWKNVKHKVQKHAESGIHKQSAERWLLYKQSQERGSIMAALSESHKASVKEKREYVGKIIDLLIYLAKQGIALRGHDEREVSTNRGNFLELCTLFARYDEAFATKLRSSFNLTNHSVENEILHIAADSLKCATVQRVQENGFYTLLVDEARKIKERFLGFVDCSKRGNAEGIYQEIKNFIQNLGISSLPIVAQSYDGAAVMAGHVNGVQKKMLDDHPTAIYVHCMAHKLNLVLVEACKVNSTAAGFFFTLEDLYKFFSQPGTHHFYLEAQKMLGMKLELTSLSDTRWACRWKNVSAVKSSMKALLDTLKDLAKPPYRRFIEASGLLKTIRDFSSSVLEKTTKTLESMRTSAKWDELWVQIQKFCEMHILRVNSGEERVHKRPLKKTAALACSFVTSTLGQREHEPGTHESPKEKWRSQLYFHVLDTMLGECHRRFAAETMEIAKSVDAVLKCDTSGLDGLLNKYSHVLNINTKLSLTEMALIKIDIPEITLENLKGAASTKFYPNFTKLFKLALTLPTGTATCERSFSAMRRVRNWMRTTMCQERLYSLCLLHIESDLTSQLNIQQIIDTYDSKSKRRIVLH
ncbi:hypothetical protein XELAEV_18015924mg [Xenopus laevis]|uniref:TTF-type domain-containing protein n=1 Tax=Xenopus laevis TaxID=8355 RepID=A0A974DIW8_XENLA|nr:hypothetical protein XELAEV_18015924mg [Xenopus laevis]